MNRSYTAMRDLICTDGGDCEKVFGIRYTFTLSPFIPASRTEPAEPSYVDRIDVRISENCGAWLSDKTVAAIAEYVFGGEEAVASWLMDQAKAQAEAARDDAADHKRQMQREDAL